MNKIQYLTISGLFLIAAGTILILSKEIGIEISKILVPLSFFISVY